MLTAIPPAALWAVTVAATSLLFCLCFGCTGPSLPAQAFWTVPRASYSSLRCSDFLCSRAQALTACEGSCGGAQAELLCGMWGLSSWTRD